METEQQTYEIPGRQLGWRVSQLRAQGIPFEVADIGGGVYVVVVQQPAGAQPFAYQPARRPKPRVELGPVLRWAAVMAAVVAVVAVLYFAFSPSDTVTAEVGGMRLDPVTGHMLPEAGWWDWLPDLPWQQAAEEPAEQGFRWPWDAAADAVADVHGTVTTVSAGVLGVLVLLIVLALVRRRR